MVEVQASIYVAKGNGGAGCPAPPFNMEEELNPRRLGVPVVYQTRPSTGWVHHP
jgi:hypothetical protein